MQNCCSKNNHGKATHVSLNDLVDKKVNNSSNLSWDFLRNSLKNPFERVLDLWLLPNKPFNTLSSNVQLQSGRIYSQERFYMHIDSFHVNPTCLEIFPQSQFSFTWTLKFGDPPITTANKRSPLHTTNINPPLNMTLHTQTPMSLAIATCLIHPLIFPLVTTSLHLLCNTTQITKGFMQHIQR
jgi:hypothetical protein